MLEKTDTQFLEFLLMFQRWDKNRILYITFIIIFSNIIVYCVLYIQYTVYIQYPVKQALSQIYFKIQFLCTTIIKRILIFDFYIFQFIISESSMIICADLSSNDSKISKSQLFIDKLTIRFCSLYINIQLAENTTKFVQRQMSDKNKN